MKHSRLIFTDDDLLFLVTTLMPEETDQQRMIRCSREDAEILEGMLADEKVLHRLLDDPTFTLLRVSPALFFSVLLARVKLDLERQSRLSMVLFDSPQVVELLSNPEVRATTSHPFWCPSFA